MRDANNLRLRLVVRRHILPEVRVVFAVQLDNDPTIANFLEQVNEIIPLESNNWGLEDYTVELRDSEGHAFDCLHFQHVSAVLKNDEQVFIRPLETGDHRKRRLSGRHQISTDGKRLVDGVAFGRPRLKVPRDRPPVDIPPLKRRRITYGDDESVEEAPPLLLTEHGEEDRGHRRVRFHVRFDDADHDGREEEEEEEDGDFVDEDGDKDSDEYDQDYESDRGSDADEDRDSDLEDELQDLRADLDHLREQRATEAKVVDKAPQDTEKELDEALDLETLDKISTLRAAFPVAPVNLCERMLLLHKDLKLAYRRLQLRYLPIMSLGDAVSTYKNRTRTGPETAAVEGREPSQPAEANDSDAESVASMVKHYDQHGFPSGSILAGTAAVQMAETMRKSGHPVKTPVHTKFDDEEPSADNDKASSPAPGVDSSSGSDEDSDSDSGPEVASSKLPKPQAGARLSDDERTSESSDSDSESQDDSSSESESEGDSDSDSDIEFDGSESDSEGSDESSDDESHGEARSAVDSSASESAESDMSSDGESSDGSSGSAEKTKTAHKVAPIAPASEPQMNTMQPSTAQEQSVQDSVPGSDLNGAAKHVPPGQGKTATQRRNARRRAALKAQKAATKGELAPGASGVSAGAESNDLMESIAAKKAALLENFKLLGIPLGEDGGHDETQKLAPPEQYVVDSGCSSAPCHNKPATEEDPEAWQNKIIYRGVECCYDGVELSEPPFPFVQRWDASQQYFARDRNQRGGRSKRKQRNQTEFQDEESRSSIKKRKYDRTSTGYGADYDEGDSYSYQQDGTGYEDTTLNYDDEPQEQPAEVKQTPSQAMDEDDLPPLPSDLSSLPPLQAGEAKVGMILTWKQWLLSKATNWQPQVSDVTGVVLDVLDGGVLSVRLAKRDRNLDQNEKVYDEDGNRVYDKFELPGMDEEDDEAAEQGYRTLDFPDMVDTRILRPVTPAVESLPSAQELSGVEGTATQHDRMPQKDTDSSNARSSTTLGQEDTGDNPVESQEADVDAQPQDQTIVFQASVDVEPSGDVSMSEDQRHEISPLINDAGFRKDRWHKIDSQPILLEPFHGFSDAISEPPEDGHVAYPKLDLPPEDTGSTHNGRQVDPDFSIELGNSSFHSVDNSKNPTSSAPQHESDGGSEESDSDVSNVTFPSLSELWPTASTSSSKSPPKAAVMSATKGRKSEVAPDLEYEEAMRHLDDSESSSSENDDAEEEPQQRHRSKLAQKLVDKPTEKPTPKKQAKQKGGTKPSTATSFTKTERVSTSPSSRNSQLPKRTTTSSTSRKSSQLSIPEGSQVVSLLTSSPEPEIVENYAEDSIDETYTEPNDNSSSLPTGSGWVVKKPSPSASSSSALRNGRGISMPATATATSTAVSRKTATPKKFASSQSKQQQQQQRGGSSSALGSLLRAKCW